MTQIYLKLNYTEVYKSFPKVKAIQLYLLKKI